MRAHSWNLGLLSFSKFIIQALFSLPNAITPLANLRLCYTLNHEASISPQCLLCPKYLKTIVFNPYYIVPFGTIRLPRLREGSNNPKCHTTTKAISTEPRSLEHQNWLIIRFAWGHLFQPSRKIPIHRSKKRIP